MCTVAPDISAGGPFRQFCGAVPQGARNQGDGEGCPYRLGAEAAEGLPQGGCDMEQRLLQANLNVGVTWSRGCYRPSSR